MRALGALLLAIAGLAGGVERSRELTRRCRLTAALRCALLPEEGAEALDFPGTDGVWTGTEPDTGRTYVIAWRDTQVIRLWCDGTLDLTSQAEAVVDADNV